MRPRPGRACDFAWDGLLAGRLRLAVCGQETQVVNRGRVADICPVHHVPLHDSLTIYQPSLLPRRTPKHIASRYYQLLSGHAAIGPYRPGGRRSMLVVRGRKETDPPPPFYGVQGVGAPDQEAVERHREGPWVEAPQGPLG